MARTDGDILRSLETLRRRVRGLLALDGLSRLIAVFIPAAAVVAALDWWVNFPWFVRATALAIGGAWALYWTWRRVAWPLVAPLPLEQLALRIDTLDADKREGLASAVSFLEGHGIGAPELREEVVTDWRSQASSRAWSRGLHPKRAFLASGAAFVMVTGFMIFHHHMPDLASIGRSRLFSPWSSLEWPRRVQIEPLTRDLASAFGESATVMMRVSRGDNPYLRAYVEWGVAGAGRRRMPMQRESDGVYRFTIDDLRSTVQYSFLAGDDDTRPQPFTIRIARRPELASAQAVVFPPPYAAGLPAVVFTIGDEPLSIVRGSLVRIEATPRRISGAASTVHRGDLVASDGRRHPLAARADGGILTGEFNVEDSGACRILLIDDSGLESIAGRAFEIVARDDEMPVVEIAEPAGDLEMTARGVVDLRILGRDDFGIRSLVLLAGVEHDRLMPVQVFVGEDDPAAENGEPERLPIDSAGSGEPPVDSGDTVQVAPELMARPLPRSVERAYSWPVRSISDALERGATIELAMEIVDNYALNGETHDARRSAHRRIRIVTEAEFAESLRQSLTTAGAQLRRMLSDLQAAEGETRRLAATPGEGKPLSADQREQSRQLAQEINRLAAAGRDAARRLRELSDRAERNQASRLDTKLQADRMERTISRIADEALRDAASALAQSAERETARDQHASLTASAAEQGRTVDELREMLESLDQWNEFADFTRLLRQLLDRQEDLIRTCSRLSTLTDGRPIEELTEAQRGPIDDAMRNQNLIRDDATSLVHGMVNMAAALVKTDLVSAGALEKAVKAAEDRALATRMAAAAAEIQQNRFRRAKVSQLDAANTLRAMIAALDERPDRELSELSKTLADLVQSVKELLKAQELIATETVGLSTAEWNSETAAKLTDRQFSLARTAEGIARRVQVTDADAMAAQFAILTAASRMESASQSIRQGNVNAAGVDQSAARVALNEAIDALAVLQKRTEQEMAERSMAAILEDLTALRESQVVLREETEQVRESIEKKAKPGRGDRTKLKTLADREAALSVLLDGVSDKMTGSIVFLRVCEDIGESISAATAALTSLDAAVAGKLQAEIIEDLERMIRALESRPRKSARKFVEAESGGGGAGDPSASRPIPPLAELKVLRMLQLDVNARTRRLDAAISKAGTPTEDQSGLIQKLGEDQLLIQQMAGQMAEGGGIR